MNIRIVTPVPASSRSGNGVTTRRWARILESLGHSIVTQYAGDDRRGNDCDLIVALHARRSHASIAESHTSHPDRPLVVALTGTDLYGDLETDADARRSLELAWRLIVLQPNGIEALPQDMRPKARVIYQSVDVSDWPAADPVVIETLESHFDVCVIGHLREVKDPFRTAEAARLLPASSSIYVTHLGAALSEDMAELARKEEADNPRYGWLGDQPRPRVLGILERSNLLVLTSRREGGANVISEAIAADVPVISSRIDGSVGLLGEDYPGYFTVGDTRALASLLHRAETDSAYHESLRDACRRLKPLIDPQRERQSWADLLRELPFGSSPPTLRQ